MAQAELALVSRDLGFPAKTLDLAQATLEERGDRLNAAHARYLEVRRLLLIGRIDEAEQRLGELDPTPFPPASRTAHELVVAGIAMRHLRTKAARAALARAERDARDANIPALTSEVENAALILNTPAARLIGPGEERLLLLDEVETLLASTALVVDSCRNVVRNGRMIVTLAKKTKSGDRSIIGKGLRLSIIFPQQSARSKKTGLAQPIVDLSLRCILPFHQTILFYG